MCLWGFLLRAQISLNFIGESTKAVCFLKDVDLLLISAKVQPTWSYFNLISYLGDSLPLTGNIHSNKRSIPTHPPGLSLSKMCHEEPDEQWVLSVNTNPSPSFSSFPRPTLHRGSESERASLASHPRSP